MSGPKYHGWTHAPNGTDPSKIGWVDLNVSDEVHLANVIKWGTNMVVSEPTEATVRVDVTNA